MAMLNPTVPIRILGCPAGACREEGRASTRAGWKTLAAAFAAGAVVTSGIVLLAGNTTAKDAVDSTAAAIGSALERQATPPQLPPKLPREWRYELKGVNVDAMYAKQR